MKATQIIRRIISKAIHTGYIFISKLLKEKGRVYMFHSIGDRRHAFNLSIESFELFLQRVKEKNIVRLDEWDKNDDFICLTFDDVADSFYYNAFPLLKKYEVPFTIFVSCSLLGREKYITEEMLREIAACELCSVGSHGWEHSYYADFNSEKAEKDISSSKKKIEMLIGRSVDLYAFPYGSIYACGIGKKKLVKRHYKYGFGTINTPITRPRLLPNYYLPRIGIIDNNFKKVLNSI